MNFCLKSIAAFALLFFFSSNLIAQNKPKESIGYLVSYSENHPFSSNEKIYLSLHIDVSGDMVFMSHKPEPEQMAALLERGGKPVFTPKTKQLIKGKIINSFPDKTLNFYTTCASEFKKADSTIFKANIIFKVIKVKLLYTDSAIFYNDYLMSKSAVGSNSAVLPAKNNPSGMLEVVIPQFVLPLPKD